MPSEGSSRVTSKPSARSTSHAQSWAPPGGVHHQHVVIVHVIHDDIVTDTSVFRANDRVLALAHSQARRVIHAHELHQIERLRARNHEFAHVRYVEEASRTTYGTVLLCDPGRVLDRHLIFGERHHLGPKTEMYIIKGGLLEGVVHGSEKLPPHMLHW